jgi:hypothetical protein
MVATRDRHRPLAARERLLERDLHLDMQIGTALRRRLPRPTLGEHLGEQIAEGCRVVDSARREVEALEPTPGLGSVCQRIPSVIPRSASRIDQGLVRLQDLAEACRRRLIARIDIRVKPARKTTVSPLDLGLARALLHAQHYVQVHS